MTRLDPNLIEVRGYRLAVDRSYHPDTHMWVRVLADDLVRIGLDPLGVETHGTLAHLSLVAVGADVVRGGVFGQLEAAKFVGPLLSPVSGTVVAVNDVVLADPAVVEREPLDAGWLVELAPKAVDELPLLLSSPTEIVDWFTGTVDDYRREGVIAQ